MSTELTVVQKAGKVIDRVTEQWSAAFDGTPEQQMDALFYLTDDMDHFYCEELATVYGTLPEDDWADALTTMVQRRKSLNKDWSEDRSVQNA
jgi:hypothetical protein